MSPTVVPWLAAVLFLGFGLKLLIDATGMRADQADEEDQEAEQALDEAESRRRISEKLFIGSAADCS